MLRPARKKKTKRQGDNNPVIVHTKRQQIMDEEGWTHVIDKPQRTTKAKPALHTGDFEIGGVSYVEKTVEELGRDFAHWVKVWKETEACKKLEEMLKEKKGKLRDVDNAVILGLGSLQSARREGRRSSATQLAALQTVMEVLGGASNVILQDPQYTELDGQFLEVLGYKVVKDPEAFGSIGAGTLVFAVHCYKEVYGEVAAQEKPALFIGTDVGNFGRFDASEKTGSILESLENLVEECDVLDFPQVSGRHDFSDTKIYWRKTGELDTTKASAVETTSNTNTTKQATDSEIPEILVHERDTLDIEEAPAGSTS